MLWHLEFKERRDESTSGRSIRYNVVRRISIYVYTYPSASEIYKQNVPFKVVS